MIFNRRRRCRAGAAPARRAASLHGKELSLEDLGSCLSDGMTIGIGGWGYQHKPMTLVRHVLESDVRDLTLVTFGGPEVAMLCASGKVSRIIQGVVAADRLLRDKNGADRNGAAGLVEMDRQLLELALQAAAMRLPFLPLHYDATGAVFGDSRLETIRSPYGNGEPLLAVPAIGLDVAFVHVDRADYAGNIELDRDDCYFDDLLAGAARLCFVSCDELVSALSPANPLRASRNPILSGQVSAVIHAPSAPGVTDAIR